MLDNLFWYIYRIPLPVVWLCMAVGVLIWAGLMRFLAWHSRKAARAVNAVLAVAALGGVLYITVFRHSAGEREVILTPFQSFIEARGQREMYREMLMNVFLFYPPGLFLPFALAPSRLGEQRREEVALSESRQASDVRGRQGSAAGYPLRYAAIAVGFAVALSVGIEIVQYAFALGRCETDDVLCNALGAALGIVAYLLQEHGD